MKLILFPLILLLTLMRAGEGNLTQNTYPDVIKCGNHFYYIGFSTPTLSRYYAAMVTGAQIQSYQVINGILRNKSGTQITSNCENEKVELLWNSGKGFKISNKGLTTSRSIYKAYNFPDGIKCENKILKASLFDPNFPGIYYFSEQDLSYATSNPNQPPGSLRGISCQNKSLNQLKADGNTFEFVTEKVTSQDSSIYSMTRKYPDLFICGNGAVLYIYSISDDQSTAVYRVFNSSALNQIVFTNDGSVQQSTQGGQIADCASKSISTLISEDRAFNINYPILLCPDDITAVNPVVNFIVSASPTLTVVSTPTSGTSFPHGKTTTVTVNASHSNGLNLSCTFGVTLQPDTEAPALTCPQNIEQIEPVVDFEATATDNSILPVEIKYDKDPGSTFSTGKTVVTATATDGAGNQAVCTLDVNILPDNIAPTLTCPNNIQQLEPVVSFEATATDNITPPVKITYDQDPGSQFPTGTTTVNVTATDASGNQSFCTFDVEIIGEDKSSSGSLIGIIVGSIAAFLVILVVVIVIVLKKKKKGCFKVKEPRAKRYQFTKRESGQSADTKSTSAKRIQW